MYICSKPLPDDHTVILLIFTMFFNFTCVVKFKFIEGLFKAILLGMLIYATKIPAFLFLPLPK